jgi:anaerobic magnesium-protoporphyrin IX monomethyl ester cyclase
VANVLLIHPEVGTLGLLRAQIILPLQLLNISLFLEPKHSVRILDQRLDRKWRPLLREALRDDPVCVGITLQTGRQINYALEIAAAVREISKVPIVCGGIHPSLLPEQTLRHPLFDYVVQGEGERAFPALVDALAEGRSPAGIPGVWVKEGDTVTGTPPDSFIDFDALPELPYHILDIERYFPHGFEHDDFWIETSRGCPYACNYCYQTVTSRGVWRPQSAATVGRRLADLVQRFGIKWFHFADDSFLSDPARGVAIAREILDRGLQVQWKVQGANVNNISELSEEDLATLVRSGCRKLHLGVESGSAAMLRQIGKPTHVAEVLTVNQRLRDHGLMPWYYFSSGQPDETYEDVRDTVQLVFRLLEENPLARVSAIYCMTPYPGTSLYRKALTKGFRPPARLEDWATFNFDTVNTPWVTPERKQLLEDLHFCTLFVDDKVADLVDIKVVRLLASLYRPVARWRLRHMEFRFLAERLSEKVFTFLSP